MVLALVQNMVKPWGGKPISGSTVTLGANFSGSDSALAGGVFPPDSDGAIGPGHFVELVNGVYRVYDETGAVVQQSSDAEFWAAAGVPFSPFDPRVIYDPDSGRWFAAALNFAGVPPAAAAIPRISFLLYPRHPIPHRAGKASRSGKLSISRGLASTKKVSIWLLPTETGETTSSSFRNRTCWSLRRRRRTPRRSSTRSRAVRGRSRSYR